MQAQIIISYEISEVDAHMLCEIMLFGGLLDAGREKDKIAYCRLVNYFAVGTESCLFLTKGF